jgi:hypothetical protein
MSLEDAFKPIEAYYQHQALAEAWGHLAPKRNKIYRGRIVYVVGCFGNDHLNPTVMACELGDLESSPWFYDALIEFLQQQQTEVGYVYEFVGTFRNYVFQGKIRAVYNANSIEAEEATRC